MTYRSYMVVIFLLFSSVASQAQTCAVPNTLTNGTTADAAQVMANFTALANCFNTNLNPLPPSGFRNRLINGNFSINQRVYLTNTALSAGTYGFDRWKAGASGATITFVAGLPDTTVTIAPGGSIQEIIEGADIEGGSYTLSWTGSAFCKIGTGAYGASPLTATAAAGTNLPIECNAGTLALVQLEPGTTATAFNRRPVAIELELAQRYFNRFSQNTLAIQTYCNGFSFPTEVFFPIPTMRVAPTITGTLTTTGSITAPTFSRITPSSFTIATTGTATGSCSIINTTTPISLSAEL